MVDRTMKLITKDGNGEYDTTTVPLQISTTATYQQLDTCGRALASLSSNTYQDVILIETVSVSEELSS